METDLEKVVYTSLASNPTWLASRGQRASLISGKNKKQKGKKSENLKVACWNVRTMQDSADNDRPQRRTALVSKELKRLDIDIAAVSEVRFAEQGSLTEQGAGYTLYWSGKSKDEHRLSGVGFMIKNTITGRLQNLPVGHSDRLMSLRLPLCEDKFLTIISVYAPTLQADPATKEGFYAELRTLLGQISKDDKILVMGDFNARVGRDFNVWPGVLGRHGIGSCNENGRLLLELCAEQGLSITNTLFQQKARFKTTWQHPRSKHWHLLDYVLVRQRDIKDVLHTRVMPSADCYTDHRLVRASLRLIIKPAAKKKGPQVKKLQIDSLQGLKQEFQNSLKERLYTPDETPLANDPEAQWQELKTTLQETTVEVVGYSTKKNRDWFDENDAEIQDLLQVKHTCYKRVLARPDDHAAKTAYKNACRTVQSKLREIQNKWWTSLAEETQRHADSGNSRAFYQALRAVYGPTQQIQVPLRSADGTSLLSDKESILHRWTEHYGTLFGDKRQVQEEAIRKIPQQTGKPGIDLNLT